MNKEVRRRALIEHNSNEAWRNYGNWNNGVNHQMIFIDESVFNLFTRGSRDRKLVVYHDITAEKCRGWYNHTYRYLLPAINNEDILM